MQWRCHINLPVSNLFSLPISSFWKEEGETAFCNGLLSAAYFALSRLRRNIFWTSNPSASPQQFKDAQALEVWESVWNFIHQIMDTHKWSDAQQGICSLWNCDSQQDWGRAPALRREDGLFISVTVMNTSTFLLIFMDGQWGTGTELNRQEEAFFFLNSTQ